MQRAEADWRSDDKEQACSETRGIEKQEVKLKLLGNAALRDGVFIRAGTYYNKAWELLGGALCPACEPRGAARRGGQGGSDRREA